MATDTTAAHHLDEAVNALAEASVALTSLYPVLTILNCPPEPRSFVEDGMDALGRARRHLNDLRVWVDTGQHSVGVGSSADDATTYELAYLNQRMERLTQTVAELMSQAPPEGDF